MALVRRTAGAGGLFALSLGLIGTALFFGDALITPAISVLSAVEGLKLATPAIEPFIIPLTIVILFALFIVQKRGTARVAAFFGPITCLWFLSLATVGAWQIFQQPVVLLSFLPSYGIGFLLHHGWISLFTLGAVFLTVTGAEALYADLGHFGKRPIRTARRTLQPSITGGMPLWQDKLFIFLARNASDATAYFQIPTDRVVEIGTRITI